MRLLKFRNFQIAVLVSFLTITTSISVKLLADKDVGRDEQITATNKARNIAEQRMGSPTTLEAPDIIEGGIAMVYVPLNVNDPPGTVRSAVPATLNTMGKDRVGMTAKAILAVNDKNQKVIVWGYPAQGVPPKK